MVTTRLLWVLLLCIAEVYTQVCVTHNFEADFEELFTYDRDVCTGQNPWILSFYSDAGISPPHPRSETFLSASSVQQSCVSTSSTFSLDTGGILEVNAMMESSSGTSFITVLIQGDDGGVLGQGQLLSTDAAPISATDGVYTIDITWVSSGTYDAYVTLMGFASEGSLVMIDSLRYVPPSVSSETCIIYVEDTETVTEEAVTEVTESETESVTESVTESATEGVTESATEGVTEGITDGITVGITEIVTEGITEGVTEGITEGITEGVTEGITEGITDGVTEVITEGVTEGVTEDVTEGATEGITEGSTASVTEEVGTEGVTDAGVTEEWVTDAVTEDGDTESVTEGGITEGTTQESVTEGVTEDGITEESVTEGITGGVNTETDVTDPQDIITEAPNIEKRPFWNALTITAVTLLCLIALCLICWCFYECGKRNSADDLPPAILFEDPDYLPKFFTVPRVTRVFSDSNYNDNLNKY